MLTGDTVSEPARILDALPFARWDALDERRRRDVPFSPVPYGGGIPLLASRGCPEFCTYCPHRILADTACARCRTSSTSSRRCAIGFRNLYVIFRDPLFTDDRDRALALADEIQARGLELRFECETRLDRLDPELLDALHGAGLRAISFGVESVSSEILRRVGRRPTRSRINGPSSIIAGAGGSPRRRSTSSASFRTIGRRLPPPSITRSRSTPRRRSSSC
jgi:radical SAM superfamily enzyme YgiQ (UPF0313 family)